MIISLCGTPGVGKTTISNLLSKDGFKLLSLKKMIEENELYVEKDHGTSEMIVEVKDIQRALEIELKGAVDDIVVDGHLSYLSPCDLCIVLRLDPNQIGERIGKRGYSEEKVRENMEAEAVGTILIEALEQENMKTPGQNWEDLVPGGGAVFEVDTTGKKPEILYKEIESIISSYQGKRLNELSQYRPGSVDWLEVAAGWY